MKVAAIFLCEVRSLARMTRTRVVIGTTFLVGIATWVHVASTSTTSVISIDVRYLISGIGGIALWTALLGVLLLGFDVHIRDARERVVECFNVRPFSNFELVAGRSVALASVAWLPLLLLGGILQAAGGVGEYVGWEINSSFEPISLVAFLFKDAPMTLLLWSSMVVLIATIVRVRIFVALASFAALASTLASMFLMPLYLKDPLFGAGSVGHIASDLIPAFTDADELLRSASIFLASMSCVLFAGTLYPRLHQSSRFFQVVLGIALCGGSLAGLGILVHDAIDQSAAHARWTDVHASQRNSVRADLKRISGSAIIRPGNLLAIDVELRLSVPEPLDALVLSLNPGLQVQTVRLDGNLVPFQHQDGLLRISPSVSRWQNRELLVSVNAQGIPEKRFGYLDSAVDPRSRSLATSRLHTLGLESAIFDERYVALVSAIRWLPAAGANYEPDRGEIAARDFYSLDLKVDVPRGWLVVGPGRGESTGSDNPTRTSYRFRPPTPISEVAVFAAPFVRRAIMSGGIEFEAFLHPDHLPKFVGLSSPLERLMSQLDLTLSVLENYGIAYPFESFSIVEIPGALRTFAGGRHMRAPLVFPGVVLLREFDAPVRHRLVQDSRLELATVPDVSSFFRSRLIGTSTVYRAASDLLWSQTSPSGPDAFELRLVLDELLNTIVGTWMSSRDSPTGMTARSFVIGDEWVPRMDYPFRIAIASVEREVGRGPSSKASAWDWLSVRNPADQAQDACDEELLGASILRSRAVAALLIDSFGMEKVGRMIGILRQRHSGDSFSWDDVVAVGRDVDVPVDRIVNALVPRGALPSFSASQAEVVRLADTDDGRPRYQTSVHVRNHGSVAGFVRLETVPIQYDPGIPTYTEPIRIDADTASHITMSYPQVPESVMIKPYLAENRGRIPVAIVDVHAESDGRPLSLQRRSQWKPDWMSWIVVDDLDDGFLVSSDEDAAEGFGRCSMVEFDAGLPAYPSDGRDVGPWSRRASRSSWGRYRRTHVRSELGIGNEAATFKATLPSVGTWTLEYHLPGGGTHDARVGQRGVHAHGIYDVRVSTTTREFGIKYDVSGEVAGWNEVAELHLDAGDVDVTVRAGAAGTLVILDAIRWRPGR